METKLRLLLLTGLCCLGASAFSQTKHLSYYFTVEDQSLIAINLDYMEHNDCVGGPGLIYIGATGGVSTLSYSWTGPGGFTSTAEDIDNLTVPGDYIVTVDDGNGCPVSKTFTVNNTCPYTCSMFGIDIINTIDPSNCSANDGELHFEILNGTGPYTWELYRVTDIYTLVSNGSGPAKFLDFTGLQQATYEISVHDATLGCTAYNNGQLNTSFYLYESYVSGTNTDCTTPNGSLNLNVIGAQLPEDLTFDWLNTETGKLVTTTDSHFDEAVQGYYNITVTDNHTGCKLYGNGYVTNYMIHLNESNTVTPFTQCTSPDGAINITVTGGTGDYAYIWTNDAFPSFNETTEDISGLAAGTYEVWAYDENSRCGIEAEITVPDNVVYPTIVTGTPIPSSACAFPFNGALSVNASGTAGPYSYGWFATDIDPFTTLPNPVDVAPGTYGYLVTDASTGCTVVVSAADAEALVVEDTSTPVVVSENIVTNTSCNTPYDGAIDITIDTSGRSYAVEWWTDDDHYNPFSTNEDLTNIPPGTYELTIAVACAANNPPVITPPNLSATSGVTTLDIDLLDFVSDPDNNLDPSSIEITSLPQSGALASLDNNGTMVTLSLDYTGITFKGTDQLRIRACDDLDVCTERDLTITVDVTAETDIIVYNAISANGDQFNTHFHIENIDQYDNRVTIYNRWGDEVYDAQDYNNEDVSFIGETENGKELPAGNYFYKIQIEGRNTLTGYLSLRR